MHEPIEGACVGITGVVDDVVAEEEVDELGLDAAALEQLEYVLDDAAAGLGEVGELKPG
jgi:hypothetical protein